uniref:YEATS domain-containing protein n=1 Tax=Glyptapanteles flavicoxis TaxID=463051 RepID=B7S8I2_9HYME|nr:YEATS domain-containing protein [Glyptapanteles flavicoxis]
MSTLKDNVQDPDYAVAGPSRQQKTFEETALINKTKRINTIIEREFDRSINEKEKEILLINDRLHEAIRTLSLLRYAIISEFYNRKECQAGVNSDSKQARIHPAIKKIIGKAPRNLRHRGSDGLSSKGDSGASTSSANGLSSFLNGVPGPSHQESQKLGQNLNELGSNHQVPSKNHQSLSANHHNHRVPGQNHQVPGQNHQVPGQNHQVPGQNHQVPGQNHQVPGQNNQVPGQNNQTSSANHKNHQVPSQNHQILLHNHQNYQHLGLTHQKYQHPGLNTKLLQAPTSSTTQTLPSNPLKRKNNQEPNTNPSKKLCPNTELEFQRGDGFRETRVIVIGNISTPIPPMDRNDDKYTHKWQVYVREKDNDKISEYISKVVFQLHPSYKPNDVIEVDRSPFNLVRRGWGNFSMNVTLIFKNKSNLPRAFVHNLTLDHVTETVYGLKIFPTNYAPPSYEPEESSSDEDEIDINENGDDGADDSDSETVFTLTRKEVMSNIYLEHRYININSIGEVNKTINHSGIKSMKDINSRNNCSRSLKPGLGALGSVMSDDMSSVSKKNHCKSVNGDKRNLLISSKAVCQPLEIKIPDMHETMASTVKQVLVFNDKQIPLNFNKEKKQNINGNGVSILKKNVNGKNNITISINPAKSVLLNVPDTEPALKIVTGKRMKLTEKKRKSINYTLKLRNSLMALEEKDVEKMVTFLAKRLPIVTPEAQDSDFKKSFPYVCQTVEEFLGFNIGKQRSVEWYRAKEVRNMLKFKVGEEKIWTTKEILLWCRFQGFTTIRPLMNSVKVEREEVNTCTESRELVEWVRKMKSSGEEKEQVEIVDIEGDDSDSGDVEEEKGEFVRLEMNEEETKMNFFVSETARQVGVTLGEEEIEEGVRDAAASRVVVKVGIYDLACDCLDVGYGVLLTGKFNHYFWADFEFDFKIVEI